METPHTPAEAFELSMVPALFEPWARRLVAIIDPQAGERILDVACGTGIAARVAASHAGPGAAVTGLDISRNMLDEARSVAGTEIAWVQGPAEAMPFPPASFDVALCQFALTSFADKQAALGEMHRVLDDDGRLGLGVWQEIERYPFYETLRDVVRWHVGTSGVDESFALGDAERLRSLVADAGFHTISIRSLSMLARFPNPEVFLTGQIEMDTVSLPTMGALAPERRQQLVAQIREDMRAVLAKVTEGDHVVLPFHAHILTAYR